MSLEESEVEDDYLNCTIEQATRTFCNNNWNYNENSPYKSRHSQRYFEKYKWQRRNNWNNSSDRQNCRRYNYHDNRESQTSSKRAERTEDYSHLSQIRSDKSRDLSLEAKDQRTAKVAPPQKEQQLQPEANKVQLNQPVNEENNFKRNKTKRLSKQSETTEEQAANSEAKQPAVEDSKQDKESSKNSKENSLQNQQKNLQSSTNKDKENKKQSSPVKNREQQQADKVHQNSQQDQNPKTIAKSSKTKTLPKTRHVHKIVKLKPSQQNSLQNKATNKQLSPLLAVEIAEEPRTTTQIQVRPLNELLREEIFTEQLLLNIKHTPPVATQTLPAAIQTRRHTLGSSTVNQSDCELNISDQLATLDKEALKYIINNSDTIYNEHLKSQARRRQREFIRQQLKDIEIGPPRETLQTEPVFDELVDALDLPQLLLQQIEKCFNINLDETKAKEQSVVEVKKLRDSEKETEEQLVATEQQVEVVKVAEEQLEVTEEQVSEEQLEVTEEQLTKVTEKQLKVTEGQLELTEEKVELFDELLEAFDELLEEENTMDVLRRWPMANKFKKSDKQKQSSPKKSIDIEACIVLSSSSEDEQEDEPETAPQLIENSREAQVDCSSQLGEGDSNSSSLDEAAAQLLQQDAAKIIASFEQHMLPQLKGSLANCYRSNRNANMQSKLHFISCMVTSPQHNPTKSFSKLLVAEIQRNLREPNNRVAIDFLAKEIDNLLKLQQTESNELNSDSTHQSNVESAESTRASLPPTPPCNEATAAQPLQEQPLGMSFLQLDASVPRLSPAHYPLPVENRPLQMGDSVMQNLLEIDRRLLEYQNRRGFLEEMILKFQKEKTDLEMVSLELTNRKYLLLNTLITRCQAAAVNSNDATPSNSAAPTTATAERGTSPMQVRKPPSRTVIVRHVKVLPKTRSRVRGRLRKRPTKSAKIGQESVEQAQESLPNSELPIKLESEHVASTAGKRVASSAPQEAAAKRLCAQPLAVIPPLPPLAPLPAPLDAKDNVAAIQESSLCITSGRLEHITSPISQIVVHKTQIFAASESGDIYVFNIVSHKLEQHIFKHSEAITNMFLCDKELCLYTTSLDGFFKKSSLGNLERVVHTGYLKEPLQSIDINWGIAYIGSRWGNIFTYNVAANKLMDMPLLSTGQSIIAIRAIKEGPRQIIMLGCKGNTVYIHDAATGLLLRRMSIAEGLNVYSLILSDAHVFCGTQKNEVYKFDFATGAICNISICGNGAVSMAAYGERFLLVGCYDGFIYVLDKTRGVAMGRFNGCGRLVLALAVAGDKVISSSKDNTLEILDIPKELLQLQGK